MEQYSQSTATCTKYSSCTMNILNLTREMALVAPLVEACVDVLGWTLQKHIIQSQV